MPRQNRLAQHLEALAPVHDAMPVGVAVWDDDGRLVRANPVFGLLLGRPEGDLDGLVFDHLVRPGEASQVVGWVADLWAGRRNHFRCDLACVALDGRPLWLEALCVPVFGPSGVPAYVISQIVDFDGVERSAGPPDAAAERRAAVAGLAGAESAPAGVVAGPAGGAVAPSGVVAVPAGEVVGASGVVARPAGEVVGASGVLRAPAGGVVEGPPASGAPGAGAGRMTVSRLVSRADLHRHLQEVLVRAARSDALVAVLACDVDRLGEVNRANGRAAGDAVLAAVADRIGQTLRGADVAARSEGDGFLVVLEDPSGLAGVQAIAQRLLAAIRQPVPLPTPPDRTPTGGADGSWSGSSVGGDGPVGGGDASPRAGSSVGGDAAAPSSVHRADRSGWPGSSAEAFGAVGFPPPADHTGGGGGEVLSVSASIGMVLAPAGALDVDRLLDQADRALARAKAGGRDRVEQFHHRRA